MPDVVTIQVNDSITSTVNQIQVVDVGYSLPAGASGSAASSVAGLVSLADYGTASAAGTALNAAISALPLNGGTIIVPNGTWTIDTEVLIGKNGVAIEGTGPGSILAFNAGTVPTMLAMADTTQRYMYMRNLKIAQTGTSGTGTALNLSYFVNSVFENLRIGDGQNPQYAVYFNAAGSYYNVVRDCRITANGGSSASYCVYLGTTCNSNIVQNCRLLGDSNTVGVYSNGNGVIVDHVDMESAGSIGIHMDASAANFTIINPYLEDLTTGIQLESGSGPGTLLNGDVGGCTTPITDNGAIGFAWENTWAWSTTLPNSCMSSSSTATQLWGVKESADTVARISVNSAGLFSFGPGGATAADVTFGRSGGGTLKITGGFQVSSNVRMLDQLTLGSLSTLGSGVGNGLEIGNTAIPPTAAPTNGVVLYSSGGKLYSEDASGATRSVLQPAVPLPEDQSLLAWAYDPAMLASSSVPTGGQIVLIRVNLRIDVPAITNVVINLITVGTALTTAENFVGLYSSAGTLLSGSADQTTNWNSSGTAGAKTIPLSAAQTNQGPGFAWVAILVNGSGLPAFGRASSAGSGINAAASAATSRFGFYGTSGSYTTLPASITPGSITQSSAIAYWAALS